MTVAVDCQITTGMATESESLWQIGLGTQHTLTEEEGKGGTKVSTRHFGEFAEHKQTGCMFMWCLAV